MTLQLFWVFLNCLNFVQIFVLFMDVFSSPTGSFPAMFDSLHLCNSLVWFFQGGGKPPDRGWGKPPLNFFGIFVEPLKQFQGEDSPEWMPWIALSCRGWLRNNATTSKTSICISNHMIIDPAISGAGNFWAKTRALFFWGFLLLNPLGWLTNNQMHIGFVLVYLVGPKVLRKAPFLQGGPVSNRSITIIYGHINHGIHRVWKPTYKVVPQFGIAKLTQITSWILWWIDHSHSGW